MAGDTTRILELLGISRSEMEKISQRKMFGYPYVVATIAKSM